MLNVEHEVTKCRENEATLRAKPVNLLKISSACALLFVTPALAQNAVKNGFFTQTTNGLGQLDPSSDLAGVTTLTGWSSTGFNIVMSSADQEVTTQYGSDDFSVWDNDNSSGANTWSGTAPTGNFVAMDGDFPGCGSTCTGPITQTVAGLTVGDTYTLTFDYAFAQQYGFTGATSQSITASIGDVSWTSPTYDLPSEGFSGWQTETLAFTATSASEVLSFLASGSVPLPPEALVADVSIPVPEPAVWAMVLVGVAGLGLVARRRRATPPLVAT